MLSWSLIDQAENLCLLNRGFRAGTIYPTKPVREWLKNNHSDLAPTSRAKLYVAITRAKHSVGIVYDFDNETNIEGVNKYIGEKQ